MCMSRVVACHQMSARRECILDCVEAALPRSTDVRRCIHGADGPEAVENNALGFWPPSFVRVASSFIITYNVVASYKS